jgi:hypothetical protein
VEIELFLKDCEKFLIVATERDKKRIDQHMKTTKDSAKAKRKADLERQRIMAEQ